MNVYQALELRTEKGEGTGLYHYTCTNSGGTSAVGYCSPWELCPDCEGHSGILRLPDQPPCGRCQDKGILRKDDPCPGHPTPAEAEAHYRQHQLDNARYDGRMDENEQRKCEVCGAWTQGVALMGEYEQFDLCDEHRNRAGLEQALEAKRSKAARS